MRGPSRLLSLFLSLCVYLQISWSRSLYFRRPFPNVFLPKSLSLNLPMTLCSLGLVRRVWFGCFARLLTSFPFLSFPSSLSQVYLSTSPAVYRRRRIITTPAMPPCLCLDSVLILNEARCVSTSLIYVYVGVRVDVVILIRRDQVRQVRQVWFDLAGLVSGLTWFLDVLPRIGYTYSVFAVLRFGV